MSDTLLYAAIRLNGSLVLQPRLGHLPIDLMHVVPVASLTMSGCVALQSRLAGLCVS